MKDNQGHPRVYVVLDVSRLSRCEWCGGYVTEDPKLLGWRGAYCSDECRSVPDPYLVARIVAMYIFPFWVLAALINPVGHIVLVPGALIILYFANNAKKKRDQAIHKGARANEQPSELSLLRSMLPYVKCPNCDEQLNLSMVGENRIYQCQYCDATGVLEIEIVGDDSGN